MLPAEAFTKIGATDSISIFPDGTVTVCLVEVGTLPSSCSFRNPILLEGYRADSILQVAEFQSA